MIVADRHFWVERCARDAYTIALPRALPAAIPLDYRKLGVLRAYERNLIADEWEFERRRYRADTRWHFIRRRPRVEFPPAFVKGREHFTAGFDHDAAPRGCLATDYDSTTRRIRIDLVRAGVDAEILDNYRPTIVVSEWVANRADCAVYYRMRVELGDVHITAATRWRHHFSLSLK